MDGVLNCVENWFDMKMAQRDDIDRDILPIFKRIIDATKAEIVISSMWRLMPSLMDDIYRVFEAHGIPSTTIIGMTPDLPHFPRGAEIAQWIADSGIKIKHFAVLDDRKDAGDGIPPDSFFRTSPQNGLTDEIADEVIKHLNSELGGNPIEIGALPNPSVGKSNK